MNEDEEEHPHASKRRAKAFTIVIFLIGLVIVAFMDAWWPGMMLVVGIPLAIRQLLLGRHFDMCMTLFVFVGGFISVQYDIAWKTLLPIVFALGGIYLLFREYLESKMQTLAEEEEDMNQEIEEEQEEEHKK